MNENVLRAIITGICFAVWPVLLGKSNASGNIGSFALVGIALIAISFFAARDIRSLAEARWSFLVIAGLVLAVGFLVFNGIFKSGPTNVGTLIAIMVAAQVLLSAVIQMASSGVSMTKIAGFALVAIGVAVVTKG